MTTKITRRRFIESSTQAVSAAIVSPAVLGRASAIADMLAPNQKPLSSYDNRVRDLLAIMTLEEKIG